MKARNRRKSFAMVATIAALLSAAQASAAPLNFTFETPVTTFATQAPGVWYTDRYAPAGFASPISFDGGNRLRHSISDADGEVDRPGAFVGGFYNTQGRKYDLPANTSAMSIDLYIPADWASTGRRMAGFWGTSNTTAFPIIEFTSDAGTPRFRGWDASVSGGWVNMGLPTGFAYDEWYTLNIEVVGANFEYTVGDLVLNASAFSSTSIANVILQGHNNNAGVSYDIHWDNFASVPEPSGLALVGTSAVCLVAASASKPGTARQ